MSHLQILNAALALFGAVMALILAVVLLLYWVHLEQAPRLQRDLPLLMAATLLFAVFGAVAGLAFVGHRRERRWAWAAQGALVLSAAGLAVLATQLAA